MSEQETRLIRCFTSVFPTLTPEEIRTASALSLDAWNSLASVTLAVVIEQEFNVQIDLLDLSELNSFDSFRTYLRQSTRE